jgi:hypothetical protein
MGAATILCLVYGSAMKTSRRDFILAADGGRFGIPTVSQATQKVEPIIDVFAVTAYGTN